MIFSMKLLLIVIIDQIISVYLGRDLGYKNQARRSKDILIHIGYTPYYILWKGFQKVADSIAPSRLCNSNVRLKTTLTQLPSSHSRMHSVFARTQSSSHSSDAISFGHSGFFAPKTATTHMANDKSLIWFQ